MKLTHEELNNLAHLARLKVEDNEKDQLISQMSSILTYVSELNNVTAGADRSLSNINRTREDVIEANDFKDKFLREAEKASGKVADYVKVSKVIKQ